MRLEAKTSKKAKRHSPGKLLCRLAFVLFVGYCLVSIISVQISTAEKKQQLAALQKKAEELKEKNAEYERLLNASDEKKYMEQLAIGRLGYAYPNEIRFYDISRN